MIIDYTKLSPDQQARWRNRSERAQKAEVQLIATRLLRDAGKMAPADAELRIKSCAEELKAILFEHDREFPPDDAELEVRELEVELERAAVATKKRNEWMAAFYSIPDAHERRFAEHAAREITAHLDPSLTVPEVKWAYFTDGTAGQFRMAEPDAIYVKTGLTDDDLALVVAHECLHRWQFKACGWTNETKAYRDDRPLAEWYIRSYGIGSRWRGQWAA